MYALYTTDSADVIALRTQLNSGRIRMTQSRTVSKQYSGISHVDDPGRRAVQNLRQNKSGICSLDALVSSCRRLQTRADMSSPPKEKVETKGGHLPAVKAGGMRIVQKHQPTAAPEPPQKDDDEEEYVSSSPPKAPVIVSGVVTKGDKDFTPAAAQVAHQKPQPCVPKLPHVQHINQHIHQPRK